MLKMLNIIRRLTARASLCALLSLFIGCSTPPQANAAPVHVSKPGALITDAVFSPGSFWYQAIPKDVVLNEKSPEYVAEFLRQKKAYYGNVAINVTTYASPVYTAAAGAPTVEVGIWDCQKKGYLDRKLAAQWTAVPIPDNALPSVGTDSEMTVYQPSSQTMWEFWRLRNLDGHWEACWGGQMKDTASNEGIWHFPYGTTATGLPFLGGQITASELQRGEIRHAIGIALVDTESYRILSWPANRSDGWNPNNASNRIPEGTRFRLDPTINVDDLKMHPVGKIIARAAQVYGFVVWDKAGSLTLRAENPLSYTAIGQPDPYPALFGGKPRYEILNGFPWDKLQFLPMNYGKH
jgi:hypothetical protein